MKRKAKCGYLTILINGKPLAKPYTGPNSKELNIKLHHLKLPFLDIYQQFHMAQTNTIKTHTTLK